jgi:hypothetical protein
VVAYIPYGKRIGTGERDGAMHHWFAGRHRRAARRPARLAVRRVTTSQGVSTPKGRSARRVPMTPTLAEELFDLFVERRREAMAKGSPEPPEWLFCSETGAAPDPRNGARLAPGAAQGSEAGGAAAEAPTARATSERR